jgi:hypothetical protein
MLGIKCILVQRTSTVQYVILIAAVQEKNPHVCQGENRTGLP